MYGSENAFSCVKRTFCVEYRFTFSIIISTDPYSRHHTTTPNQPYPTNNYIVGKCALHCGASFSVLQKKTVYSENNNAFGKIM